MKKLHLLLLVGSVLFLSQSCKKDTCPEINCNSGTVLTASCTCDCPNGFSGTNCEIEDLCITQNPDCKNGGTCTDGTCECPDGYEGSDCSELWSAKYLHEDYNVVSVCGTDMDSFSGRISLDSSDELKIQIHLTDQFELTLVADLLSSTTFNVPEQEIIQGLAPVSGAGAIDDKGVVTLVLTADNEPCTYTYTRN